MSRLKIVISAPHRLLFLVGVVNLLVSIAWWAGVLVDWHGTPIGMPVIEGLPANALHGPMMLYFVLPPLFFGFLLTTFPRWMGFADIAPRFYVPVAVMYLISALALWASAFGGGAPWLRFAGIAAFIAFVMGLILLATYAVREKLEGRGPTWHSWSALLAFAFGLWAFSYFIWPRGAESLKIANRVGLFLFALPIFMTVCHRMLPFFAGNVVQGYERWRPFWLLAVYWIASIVLMFDQLQDQPMIAALAALILCILTAYMLFRWWPRAKAPGLLWVLFIGFLWAPVGYLLEALSLNGVQMGRAPDHALTIGFIGSLIVAMVTRVSQGHSGRPLVMPAMGWLAFVLIQVAALSRIGAGLQSENGRWLMVSALVFALGILPWVVRSALIYMRARADGKPG